MGPRRFVRKLTRNRRGELRSLGATAKTQCTANGAIISQNGEKQGANAGAEEKVKVPV